MKNQTSRTLALRLTSSSISIGSIAFADAEALWNYLKANQPKTPAPTEPSSDPATKYLAEGKSITKLAPSPIPHEYKPKNKAKTAPVLVIPDALDMEAQLKAAFARITKEEKEA